MEGVNRYTVVHSWTVAVFFVDTRPLDAIVFRHDLLGGDDPKASLPTNESGLPGANPLWTGRSYRVRSLVSMLI